MFSTKEPENPVVMFFQQVIQNHLYAQLAKPNYYCKLSQGGSDLENMGQECIYI